MERGRLQGIKNRIKGVRRKKKRSPSTATREGENSSNRKGDDYPRQGKKAERTRFFRKESSRDDASHGRGVLIYVGCTQAF